MNCPYCGEPIMDENLLNVGRYFDSGYRDDIYYDEFRCLCPHCDKIFSWFKNYVRVADNCSKMDGDE